MRVLPILGFLLVPPKWAPDRRMPTRQRSPSTTTEPGEQFTADALLARSDIAL